MRRAVAAVAAVAILAAAAVGALLLAALDDPSGDDIPPPAATPAHPQAVGEAPVIDRPATDRVVPPDAAVDVKKAFGARGDGTTDDTAALQTAVRAGLGHLNPQRVLYLPAGVYRLTRPLVWQSEDGTWGSGVSLVGENRDDVVLRLDDAADGFGDRDRPTGVVVTGSQNAVSSSGEGNQAFENNLADLTVDVGARNPGAVGIDYLANNRGVIRNVVVRAPPGSGATGISMTRRWPGPCLLQDVRVSGFGVGVEVARWEYGVTGEHVRLAGQRVAGIVLGGNVLSLRDLRSSNTVPALLSRGEGSRDSMFVLDGAVLDGGATDEAAVVSDGNGLLRDVRASGYGVDVRTLLGNHWLAGHATWRLGSESGVEPLSEDAGARLPVEDAPAMSAAPVQQWASVMAYGGIPDDDVDDTEAIQQALDSGHKVVYLRAGWYQVSRPLVVPPGVDAVVGFGAALDSRGGAFATSRPPGVFDVTAGPSPLTVAEIYFRAAPAGLDVSSRAGRAVHLRDLHLSEQPFDGGAGDLYLTNVEGGGPWIFRSGQQVWARQLNAERAGTKIRNQGALLWVLGLKTEADGTVVSSGELARTEVLGGLLLPAEPTGAGTPAFEVTGSARQMLTFVVSAVDGPRAYDVLSVSRCDGGQLRLRAEDVPRRGGHGSVVNGYSSQCPSTARQ